MTPMLTLPLAAASLALAVGMSSPAVSQQPPPQGGAAQQQSAPPAAGGEQIRITEEKLQTYASAKQQLEEINRQWAERIQGSENAEAATEMRQQAQDEMINAVREEGLRVAEFNAIFEMEQRDPQIRAAIAEMSQ